MGANDDLTPSQRAAVEHTEGPLLVLAGPGSGKTRVITRRIARIIESGVPPQRVLAITFTNKAAGEMAARVERLIPGARVWISTFHRFCARLLRSRAACVGLRPNYTILSTDDQRRLVRDTIHDLNLDAVHFPPGRIAEHISRAKNDLITADSYHQLREERIGSVLDSVVARVYPEYQRRLLASNAVDFDDLLLHVVNILSENPEIREELDDRFRYVLVDEYQDTNLAQYQIVAGLSRNYPNLCVTGDPDQSIYGWRGARIENILRFEKDYPGAAVVRLEENFRSTPPILRVADDLIAHNRHRKQKVMRTDNPDGPPVELLCYADGEAEANGIAQSIRESVEKGAWSWSDFAIFYRVNALSREVERALARLKVPYQVAAGVAFYERAEIKDVLAYLRLIVNPADRLAFLRVVNAPARGIGKTSLERLTAWADAESITLIEAAVRAKSCPRLPKKATAALVEFGEMIGALAASEITSMRTFVEQVLVRAGYTREWEGSPLEQDQQRLANVHEFITAAHQYDVINPQERSLESFLETTSLVGDADNLDENSPRVTLMTLHSAKGLEYPVVYLVGLEQGFLPHERSVRAEDAREIEEERRLLFVGLTPAEKELTLTRTKSRVIRGKMLMTIPSEFAREMGLKETELLPAGDPWAALVTSPPRDEYDNSSPHDEEDDVHHPPDDDSFEERPASAAKKRTAARTAQPLLMTGADLLNGAVASSAGIIQSFAIGAAVRHPQYGVGTVVNVDGFGRSRTLTVEFADDRRTHTFIAAKNPLQPVGNG